MADKPAKKTIRRVKDPETFRERAAKAAEGGNPEKGRLKKAGSGAAKPLKKSTSLIGRILLPRFMQNSWNELRLVRWPSLSESRRLTFAVIVFAIIFGLSIAGVDWVLNKLFEQLLLM